jgi:mannose-6-phosphate isomerase-like protein (cupin superfamily)
MPDSIRAEDATPVVAPDGSELRPLCRIPGAGSFAEFTLRPGQVSGAVSHATVQEIWYVIGGSGQIWRRHAGGEEITVLGAGVCLTIPLGTAFQFRADSGPEPLRIVAATMPPWPEDDAAEARPERGPWT